MKQVNWNAIFETYLLNAKNNEHSRNILLLDSVQADYIEMNIAMTVYLDDKKEKLLRNEVLAEDCIPVNRLAAEVLRRFNLCFKEIKDAKLN